MKPSTILEKQKTVLDVRLLLILIHSTQAGATMEPCSLFYIHW